MNKQISQYLDLLRVIAAFLVVLAHASDPMISGGKFNTPSEIGYSSVMVFFVLSGYVIFYVAAEREHTLVDFAISRISRVYSVVLPAIILIVLIDILFFQIKPLFNTEEFMKTIPLYQYAKFPEYFIMDILFGNNLWGMHEPVFSNGVYWSMCQEVYFYVMFAAAFYFRGAARVLLTLLVLALVGPWVWLRFHLWLLGGAVYWIHRHYTIPASAARMLFVLTAGFMAFDLATDLNLRIDAGLDALTNGWVTHSVLRRFAGDTLTGLAIALNILSARYVGLNFGRFGSWFTYLASFSFSLYLMHIPLLRFWSAYWHPGPTVTIALVLASIWLLGQITEKQKGHIRNALRRGVAGRHGWVRSSGP